MNLPKLYSIITNRIATKPADSYVANLVAQGSDRVIQKVGEEAIEIVIAAKNSNQTRLVSEITDLLFHLTILMCTRNITLADINQELAQRNHE